MIFRQLFDRESCTYTYILADENSRQCCVIDPVFDCFDRDLQVLEELGLKVSLVLDTHVHADHITGAKSYVDRYGCEYGASVNGNLNIEYKKLNDGDSMQVGDIHIKTITTPGHTDTCVSYLVDNMVFTGDALMIRGCGRTDFQQGSPETLFESVREKLFSLPDETIVYPGHDYKGRMHSTINEEKQHNPRLKTENDFETFKQIMDGLNLAPPAKIKEALPANLNGGK